MKFIAIVALSLGLTYGATAQDSYHGKKISEKGAIPAAQLASNLGNKAEAKTKVEGTVESVCQMKGCWMKLKTADGQTMRVTFKDYGFFVPKDISGKTVVVEGVAKQTTTPVSELRHYAEDAGKSKEEIAKITEPEKAITFVADGVIVKN
ncbi:hypothetical protein FAES_3000 [Fibrella aestuarina BUZ 2]|uniref:DUF4920 domain-containing protein n=1 Tax=Fibrella aestuarina BUZ 2 TaxID=1166018 RepID=I0KA56_9BACT|nr:DUF4920 domain-containing protein [Fibrella aestuarina]CCH01009.1 hypothetical protein FAES_3000 [Fibrella aestuarina BUZ 2]